MRKILFIVIFVSVFAGCDRQRDLYDTVSPLLRVEGNWVPALGNAGANMVGNATAMFYKQGNDIIKEYFYVPNRVTARVSHGEYDILLFNGQMFAEDNTNLNFIYFRNTDNVETFEAVAEEAAPNRRMARVDGEYLASSEMEILTSVRHKMFAEGEKRYFLKYKNGHNGYPVAEDYVESEIELAPLAVSYYTYVIVHVINPGSLNGGIAVGALRGFAGSAFMAQGKASHFEVTHQFQLKPNGVTRAADPKIGLINFEPFVTFGPPLDLPNRRYTLELNISLIDGYELSKTYDVTEQVEVAIKDIKDYHNNLTDKPPIIVIEITEAVELHEIDWSRYEDGVGIGVNDWGPDEIIVVPVR